MGWGSCQSVEPMGTPDTTLIVHYLTKEVSQVSTSANGGTQRWTCWRAQFQEAPGVLLFESLKPLLFLVHNDNAPVSSSCQCPLSSQEATIG